MGMRIASSGITVLLFFGLAPETATAVDLIGTRGRALFVDRDGGERDRALVRFSRNSAIAEPLPDPTSTDSSVRFYSETSGVRDLILDPVRWSAINRGYRYDDSAAQSGVRRITLRAGRSGGYLVVQAQGAAFGADPVRGPSAFVEAELTVGTQRYCGRLEPPSAVASANRPDRLSYRGTLSACTVLVEPEPEEDKGTCTLDPDASLLGLHLAIVSISLVPEGDIALSCTTDSLGQTPCTCELNLEPINIIGLGDLCAFPAPGCSDGELRCDGGTPLDIEVDAERDIGPCDSYGDCAASCDARCAGLGSGFARGYSACEDICVGGANDGAACALDAECPGGECPGPDGGLEGNICECSCEGTGLGVPSPPGSLTCEAGVGFTVEVDENGICGDTAPAVTLAPVCTRLTTATATGRLGSTVTGTALGPESVVGAPATCSKLAVGDPDGIVLAGYRPAFGSLIGDILIEAELACLSGPPATATPTGTATPIPTATTSPTPSGGVGCCSYVRLGGAFCTFTDGDSCLVGGGTVGAPGTQCDAVTGGCALPPPYTRGNCCQLPPSPTTVACVIGPGVEGICGAGPNPGVVFPGTNCFEHGCL